jgi:uncharacterized repeat protein (TIGR03803 family)
MIEKCTQETTLPMKIVSLFALVAATFANGLVLCAQPLQAEALLNFPLGPRYPDCTLVEGSDGWFYGTTTMGGTHNAGTVFKVSTNHVCATLFSFDGTNGAAPAGSLVVAVDGSLYGTTRGGGIFGKGVVFRLGTNGTVSTIASFNGPDCCVDATGLIAAGDGSFFGTTREGGSNNLGSVFQVSTNGVMTTLASFSGTNGFRPNGVVLGTDGDLYGTTDSGGLGFINRASSGWGTVFKLSHNGELITLTAFVGPNGLGPIGLVSANDGNLYGITGEGGRDWSSGANFGTVFRVTPGGLVTTLVSFEGTNGYSPTTLVAGGDGNLYGATSGGTIFKLNAAGDLTTLASFDNQEWIDTHPLLLGRDGNFYGTMGNCCSFALGTVFQLRTNGNWTTLVRFTEESASDISSLVAGRDGNFYGTTQYGGTEGSGSIFEISSNGAFSTLVSFQASSAPWPGQLMMGSDGIFYGTTAQWGSGTLFRASANWELTTLYSFTNSWPLRMALSQSGDFYGVMQLRTYGFSPPLKYSLFKLSVGGLLSTFLTNLATYPTPDSFPGILTFGPDGAFNNSATGGIVTVSTNGEVSTLATFGGAIGSGPNALVLGGDGNFYGTTPDGGVTYMNQTNTGFGTVFKLTPNGVRTTLVSFDSTNGASPAGLLSGNDGTFYGVASAPFNRAAAGMIFRVTTTGALDILALFNPSIGSPTNLVLGNDGNLYGTTAPADGGGTFFRLVIPRLKSAAREPDGSIRVHGSGPPRQNFRIWRSFDLSNPPASWEVLSTGSFDPSGSLSIIATGSPSGRNAFFELSVP